MMTAILITGLVCALIGVWSSHRIARELSRPVVPLLSYDPRVCQCGHTLSQHNQYTRSCWVGMYDSQRLCDCRIYVQADEQTARKAKINFG